MEAGTEPTEKLIGVNMPRKLVFEQQFNDEKSTGVKFVAEWQAKDTRDEEDNLGD